MNLFDNFFIKEFKKLSLVCNEVVCTFSELKAKTIIVANEIYSLISPKAHIGILLGTSTEFIISFLSITTSYSIAVIYNPSWSSTQLLKIISLYPVDLIFIDQERLQKYSRFFTEYKLYPSKYLNLFYLKRISNNLNYFYSSQGLNPIFIGFTSGTTNLPKGFIQTHESWFKSFTISSKIFTLTDEMVHVAPGPLHHGLTLYSVIESIITGTTAVINTKFNSEYLKNIFNSYNNIVLTLVPIMLSKITNEVNDKNLKFHNVRKIIVAGAKLDANFCLNAKHSFPNAELHEYYGASELGFIGVRKINKISDLNNGFIPFPGVEIEIRDEEFKKLLNIIIPETFGLKASM